MIKTNLKFKKSVLCLCLTVMACAVFSVLFFGNIANGENSNVKAINTEADLNVAIETGGTFALVSDVDITSKKDIVAKDASYQFDLDLGSFSLVANGNSRMFNIANNNGAQITIESSQAGKLDGAGISVENNTGNVNISGVTFQNCTAETGAALSLKDASVALNNVVINWCSASAYGSAIYCADNNSAINTSLKLANSTITNNVGGLGSVYIDTNSAIIPNVTLSGANTITGNSADVYVPSFKNFKFNLVGSLLNSKIGVNTADVIEDGEEVTFTAGFASNSNGANPSDVFASNNSNYKVVWNANNNEAALSTTEKSAMYSVEFEFDGNGIVNSVNNSYKAGQTVEVYTSANAGYKFEKLTVNGEDVFNTNFIMPSCNTTVYASFIKVNADSYVDVIMPFGEFGWTYSGETPAEWNLDPDVEGNYVKSFPLNTRVIDAVSEWDKTKLTDNNGQTCNELFIRSCVGQYLYQTTPVMGYKIEGHFDSFVWDVCVLNSADNKPISDAKFRYLYYNSYEGCQYEDFGPSGDDGKIHIEFSPYGLFQLFVVYADGYDSIVYDYDSSIPEKIYLNAKDDESSISVQFASNIKNCLFASISLFDSGEYAQLLSVGSKFSYDFKDGLYFGIKTVKWSGEDMKILCIFDSEGNVLYKLCSGVSSGIFPTTWYFVDNDGNRVNLDNDVEDEYPLKDGYKFYGLFSVPSLYFRMIFGDASLLSAYNNNNGQESELNVSNTVNDVTVEYNDSFVDYTVYPGTKFKLIDGQISYEGTYHIGSAINDEREPDQFDTKGTIKSSSDNLYISKAYFNDYCLEEGDEEGITISDSKLYTVALEFEERAPEVYNITCENTEHGSITASAETAAAGDIVTLTATPDEGYELDTVTSEQVTIENMRFKMPAEDVLVKATFKKTEKPEPGPEPQPGHETEGGNGIAQTGDISIAYMLGFAILFTISLGLCFLSRRKFFNVK